MEQKQTKRKLHEDQPGALFAEEKISRPMPTKEIGRRFKHCPGYFGYECTNIIYFNRSSIFTLYCVGCKKVVTNRKKALQKTKVRLLKQLHTIFRHVPLE